jgi:hypothetical protein
MTGVMPLPAVTNRTFAGRAGGNVNSPAGTSRCRIMPLRARCRSWVLTAPPATPFTVTVMSPSRRPGELVTE